MKNLSFFNWARAVWFIPALALQISLSACGSMPKHALARAPQQSALIFKGAPLGTIVQVDGRAIVTITKVKTVVPLADGSHEVKLRSGSRVIYARTIFIEDGSQKIIQINPN